MVAGFGKIVGFSKKMGNGQVTSELAYKGHSKSLFSL